MDWTCEHCGDIIGVYEAMIVVEGDAERRTSRLNDPHVEEGEVALYHEPCWLGEVEAPA